MLFFDFVCLCSGGVLLHRNLRSRPSSNVVGCHCVVMPECLPQEQWMEENHHRLCRGHFCFFVGCFVIEGSAGSSRIADHSGAWTVGGGISGMAKGSANRLSEQMIQWRSILDSYTWQRHLSLICSGGICMAQSGRVEVKSGNWRFGVWRLDVLRGPVLSYSHDLQSNWEICSNLKWESSALFQCLFLLIQQAYSRCHSGGGYLRSYEPPHACAASHLISRFNLPHPGQHIAHREDSTFIMTFSATCSYLLGSNRLFKLCTRSNIYQ